MTIEELKLFAADMGEKPFRGKQIFIWLNRGVRDFDEMTDLSKSFRAKLKDACTKAAGSEGAIRIGGCTIAGVQEDKTDGTRKFLFACDWTKPGATNERTSETATDFVEGVFMKYNNIVLQYSF